MAASKASRVPSAAATAAGAFMGVGAGVFGGMIGAPLPWFIGARCVT